MSPRISGVRRPRHRPYLARPWQRVTCVFLLLLSCCTPLASNAYELVCQPEAVVTTCAGGGVPGFREGVQERSHFRSPSGVVVSAHDGHVYVSDAGNNRVRKIEVDTNRVTTAVGSGQNGFQDGHTSRAQLSNPQGLAFPPTACCSSPTAVTIASGSWILWFRAWRRSRAAGGLGTKTTRTQCGRRLIRL